jgi:hypothetical protein
MNGARGACAGGQAGRQQWRGESALFPLIALEPPQVVVQVMAQLARRIGSVHAGAMPTWLPSWTPWPLFGARGFGRGRFSPEHPRNRPVKKNSHRSYELLPSGDLSKK